MGWASHHIETLRSGKTTTFRPRGHSMTGRVNDGDLCTVRPLVEDETLKAGDVVLCRVRGAQYLHLVKAVRNGQYQIGNNRGGINGWASRNAIFGILTNVEK